MGFWNRIFTFKGSSHKSDIPQAQSIHTQAISNSERPASPRSAAQTVVQVQSGATRQQVISFQNAARNGDANTVEALLKEHPDLAFSKDEQFGATALHHAVGRGRKQISELLLAHKAEVNSTDKDRRTALHWAADHNERELASLLLGGNADVNAKAIDGMTPLHHAAGGGDKDMTELLLAHQAEVDAQDAAGRTPLHYAVSEGHKEVAALLLAHKADVNAKVRKSPGGTALHWAASKGYQEVAELLLAHKADFTSKDNQGFTPVYYAKKNGHNDLAELLTVAAQAQGVVPLGEGAAGVPKCPLCQGELRSARGSPVSPHVDVHHCGICGWRKLRCPESECGGYLEGEDHGAWVQYRCPKCQWSGSANGPIFR